MGQTSVPRTSVSQELNSHRKNALTTREMVTTSNPVSALRKSCCTAYRSCIGSSGRNFITIVSGPIDSDRANTSYPSTDCCRCISRSPVDDQRVPRLVPQVERLDGDPHRAQRVAVTGVVGHRPQPPEQRLERARPVVLGAEQQPDEVFNVGHDSP